MMDDLYDHVGGEPSADAPGALPKSIEETATKFRTEALALSDRLQREADELARLDEAA